MPAGCAWSARRVRRGRSRRARRPAVRAWRSTPQDPTSRRVVRAIVELVLSELPVAPASHTELATVARWVGVGEPALAGRSRTPHDHDERHPYLAFQHELCISCGRCVRACDEVQGAFALTATGRGFTANVTAGLDSGFRESTCVSCGACADTCPTDAITEITLLLAMTDDALRCHRHDHLRLLRRRLPSGGARPRRQDRLDLARRSTARPTRATPA